MGVATPGVEKTHPIYKCKYVYVHIWVRQQLEYTAKTEKKRRDSLVTVGITNRD
jgi:hypothetical protein